MLLCPECYENAYKNQADSIMKPCLKDPHLLIWAFAEQFGYWPAKVMAFNAADHIVNVRFFGDGTDGYIPSSNCFLFTEKVPDNNVHSKDQDGLTLAI